MKPVPPKGRLKVLHQHVFAAKLRFCLFCLEYILFIPPPMRELQRDLTKVESYGMPYVSKWVKKVSQKYFS